MPTPSAARVAIIGAGTVGATIAFSLIGMKTVDYNNQEYQANDLPVCIICAANPLSERLCRIPTVSFTLVQVQASTCSVQYEFTEPDLYFATRDCTSVSPW